MKAWNLFCFPETPDDGPVRTSRSQRDSNPGNTVLVGCPDICSATHSWECVSSGLLGGLFCETFLGMCR